MTYERAKKLKSVQLEPLSPLAQSVEERLAVAPAELPRSPMRRFATAARTQRQAVQPVFRAAEQYQQPQQLALPSAPPTDPEALALALQRQAQRAAPVVAPQQPQSPADWVAVMRQSAQQLEGRALNPREQGQFTALQRQVSQTLAQHFRGDRAAPAQRASEFGLHLAALQRHALSRPVAQVTLGLLPKGEQPAVQRAMAQIMQRETEEAALDQAILRAAAPADDTHTLRPETRATIQERQSAGRALSRPARRLFEQALNVPLSGVRVVLDAGLCWALGAKAFTYGQTIFVGSTAVSPENINTWTHELWHTHQQRTGQVGGQLDQIDPDPRAEQEAQVKADQLAPSLYQQFQSQHIALLEAGPLISTEAGPGQSLQKQQGPAQSNTARPSPLAPPRPSISFKELSPEGFPLLRPRVQPMIVINERGVIVRDQGDSQSRKLEYLEPGVKVYMEPNMIVSPWSRVVTPKGQVGYVLSKDLKPYRPHQKLDASVSERVSYVMKSVSHSPKHMARLPKKVLDWYLENKWQFALTMCGLMIAESIVLDLIVTPEPMITKAVAIGLQLLIVSLAGADVMTVFKDCGVALEKWLTLSWNSGGDQAMLDQAAEAFIDGIGQMIMLAMAFRDVKSGHSEGLHIFVKKSPELENSPKIIQELAPILP